MLVGRVVLPVVLASLIMALASVGRASCDPLITIDGDLADWVEAGAVMYADSTGDSLGPGTATVADSFARSTLGTTEDSNHYQWSKSPSEATVDCWGSDFVMWNNVTSSGAGITDFTAVDFDLSVEMKQTGEPWSSGITYRESNSATQVDGYYMLLAGSQQSGGINYAALRKFTGGQGQTIAETWFAPIAYDVFHTFRVKVDGNHHQLWVNGSLRLDVNDNGKLAGGYIGFHRDSGIARFDNLSIRSSAEPVVFSDTFTRSTLGTTEDPNHYQWAKNPSGATVTCWGSDLVMWNDVESANAGITGLRAADFDLSVDLLQMWEPWSSGIIYRESALAAQSDGYYMLLAGSEEAGGMNYAALERFTGPGQSSLIADAWFEALPYEEFHPIRVRVVGGHHELWIGEAKVIDAFDDSKLTGGYIGFHKDYQVAKFDNLNVSIVPSPPVVDDTFTRSALGSTEDSSHYQWVKSPSEAVVDCWGSDLVMWNNVTSSGAGIASFTAADIDLSVDMLQTGAPWSSGVTYRESSPATQSDGYYMLLAGSEEVGGINYAALKRFTGPGQSQTVAETWFTALPYNACHLIRVRVVGSHHELWVGAAKVLDASDTGKLTGGYVGFHRDNGVARFDNLNLNPVGPAHDVTSVGLFRDSERLNFVAKLAGDVPSDLTLTWGLALAGSSTNGAPVAGLVNANRRVVFSASNGVSAESWNTQTGAWETLQAPTQAGVSVEDDTVTFGVTLDALKSSVSQALLLSVVSGAGDLAPDQGSYSYDPTSSSPLVWSMSFPSMHHSWVPDAADLRRVWFAEDSTNFYYRLDFNGTFDQSSYLGYPMVQLNTANSTTTNGFRWSIGAPSSVEVWHNGQPISPSTCVHIGANNSSIEGCCPLSTMEFASGAPFQFDCFCWGVDRRYPESGSLTNGWSFDYTRDWSLATSEDYLGYNAGRANIYYWDEVPSTQLRTDINITNSDSQSKNITVAGRFVDGVGASLGTSTATVTVPANGTAAAPITLTTSTRGYIAGYYSLKIGNDVVCPEKRTTFAVIPRPDLSSGTVNASVLGGNIYWSDYIVNHGDYPGGAEIAKRYGFKQARLQIPWRSINTSYGVYDWLCDSTGQMPIHPSLDALQAAGLTVTGKIWGSPSWQLDSGDPWCYPPNQDSAYSDFVQALLTECGSQVSEWFVWNEQNAAMGVDAATGQPDGWTPSRFTTFAANAYAAIKTAHPNDKVMSNFSYGGADWMEDAYNAGAMPYIDVQGMHLYIGAVGDEANFDIAAMPFYRMRRLMDLYGGQNKPMFLDETGWGGPTETEDGRWVRATEPAKVISRVLGSKWGLNLYRVGFHQFGAGSTDSSVFCDDHNRPKPLSCAMAVAANMLDGGRYAGTLDLGSNVENHIVLKGSQPVLVVWSSTDSQTISVPSLASSVTVIDLMGNTTTVYPSGGAFALPLVHREPVYVTGWQSTVWSEVDAAIFPFKFAALTQPDVPVELNVTVHNGSGQAQTGQLALTNTTFLSISPSSRSFTDVQPGQSVSLPFSVTLGSGSSTGTQRITASVTGRSDILTVNAPFRVMGSVPLLHAVEATASSYAEGFYASLVTDGKADTEWKPANSTGPHTLEIKFDPARTTKEVVVMRDTTQGTPALPLKVDLWQDGDWVQAGSATLTTSNEFTSVPLTSGLAVGVSRLRLRFDQEGSDSTILPVIREVYLPAKHTSGDYDPTPIASTSAVKVSQIIDTDAMTPWVAAGSTPQWVMLDLGAVRTVHSATLLFDSTVGLRPTGFKIQSRNDATGAWQDQYEFGGTPGSQVTCTLPSNVDARRVRVLVTSVPQGVAARIGDMSVSSDLHPGSLSGMVTDLASGAPISGAHVQVDTGESTTTASDGTYSIVDVSVGFRSVSAYDGAHMPKTRITEVEGADTTIGFALGTIPEPVPAITDTFTRSSLGTTEDSNYYPWAESPYGATVTCWGSDLVMWNDVVSSDAGITVFDVADFDLSVDLLQMWGPWSSGITYRESTAASQYDGYYMLFAGSTQAGGIYYAALKRFIAGQGQTIAETWFDAIPYEVYHSIRVRATGGHHELWLNTTKLIDAFDDSKLTSGYVGFHKDYQVAKFDNLDIHTIPTVTDTFTRSTLGTTEDQDHHPWTKSPSGATVTCWGSDLVMWNDVVSSGAAISDLTTADFDLSVDAMQIWEPWSSGVTYRESSPGTQADGYYMLLAGSDEDGGIYYAALKRFTGQGQSQTIAEAWFDLIPYKVYNPIRVRVVGDHHEMWVGGAKVIDAFDSGKLTSGYIGFHKDSGVARFDNLDLHVISAPEVVSDTFTRAQLGTTEDANQYPWTKSPAQATVTCWGSDLVMWNDVVSSGAGITDFTAADFEMAVDLLQAWGPWSSGITYRESNPAAQNDGYYMLFAGDTQAGGMYYAALKRFTSPSQSQTLAEAWFDVISYEAYHSIRLRVIGSHHELWLGSTKLIDVFDTGKLGSGYIGFHKDYQVARFDNMIIRSTTW